MRRPWSLPPRPFSTALVVRVAAVWMFIRFAAAGVESDAGVPFAESLTGPSLGAVWAIAFVLVALRVELGRRRELVFLANLGHPFTVIGAWIVAECVLLEVVMRMAVG